MRTIVAQLTTRTRTERPGAKRAKSARGCGGVPAQPPCAGAIREGERRMTDTFDRGPGLVERAPDACLEGHRWGPGDALVLSPVCSCRHSRGGHHRAWHCETPGCRRPELRRGPCEFDPDDERTWPRPTRV